MSLKRKKKINHNYLFLSYNHAACKRKRTTTKRRKRQKKNVALLRYFTFSLIMIKYKHWSCSSQCDMLSFPYGKITESSYHKRLPSLKAQSIEGLETLQTQRQSTTNCLEEMNKAQGSIWQCIGKGWDRHIVNQTNTQELWKATDIGETSERWGGAHMGFPKYTDAILNWIGR